MSDDWRDTDEQADEQDGAAHEPVPVSDLGYASSLLRAAAALSLALWLIAVVASTLFQLDQFNGIDQFGGPRRPSPVLAALAAGLNNTWGYLLVAVVAFAAAAMLARPDEAGGAPSSPGDDG